MAKPLVAGLTLFAWMLFAASWPRSGVAMTKEYSVTGRVIDVSAGTIEIETSEGVLQFSGAKLEESRLKSLSPGDEITIRYRLDAIELEAGSEPSESQAPGKLDDRAFYNAGVLEKERSFNCNLLA